MDHVDPQASDREDHRFGQGLGPGAAVDVAADGRHRGDVRQRVKMVGIADIARVQDAVDAFESLQCLGAEQQAMGVGDDADAVRKRWLPSLSGTSLNFGGDLVNNGLARATPVLIVVTAEVEFSLHQNAPVVDVQYPNKGLHDQSAALVNDDLSMTAITSRAPVSLETDTSQSGTSA